MIKFTASNVVAMILFIPLLVVLGLILAFLVPVLAIIAAVAGMLLTIFLVYARIGIAREKGGRKKSEIDVKDYRIK